GYVRTVADRLDANFPGRVRGADLTVTSTLPLAAGMSSSSALVVGLALCLIDLSEIAADPAFTSEITSPEQLGEYLGTVENGQRSEERRVGKECRAQRAPGPDSRGQCGGHAGGTVTDDARGEERERPGANEARGVATRVV